MIPTSLYVHFPWCLVKCPYCDFNSYPIPGEFLQLESAYIDALLADFKQEFLSMQKRNVRMGSESFRLKQTDPCGLVFNKQPKCEGSIGSIYFGGGTPTLFSAESYQLLLAAFNEYLHFPQDVEITIEANPGSIDLKKACALRALGINRISLGVQSFQDDKLRAIGRIHDRKTALASVECFKNAGFENFNIDLMYGLPKQSVADANFDIKMALSLQPTHISYYQLTIEPETGFYLQQPVLPNEDLIWQMQKSGQRLLNDAGFNRYEISAYCKPVFQCQHNLNYWLFGDYIGIGAGAHGKITLAKADKLSIERYSKIRNPELFIAAKNSYLADMQIIPKYKLPMEFMLNALRLYRKIPFKLFTKKTGLRFEDIKKPLFLAREKGLIEYDDKHFAATKNGHDFLNDLLLMFV